MRIMEIISGTAVNGAAANCRDISRELHRRGHEIVLVCRPNSWIADQLAHDGIEIIESELYRWPTDQLRRIAQVIRERDIEVVHTHMSRANFFGILLRRLFGIRACVATAHNRYVQLHWMFNDRVIAVSEATRAFHRRYNLVRDRRIDVVPNAIDDERFHHVPREEGLAVREELGIPMDAKLIGVLGDVIPRKGLIHLVRAMPSILAQHPDAHLLCAGHAQRDYATQVRDEVKQLGIHRKITWAGPRSDVDRIFAALDVYALPSLEENMPLAILEAMASGLPVVSSAVGGIPECVLDGQTGFLVPPAQVTQLANALNRLLTSADLRRDFGRAGRELVRERFSIRTQIQRIETVFAKAVA